MVKEHILFQSNTTKLTRNEHVALNGAGGGTVGEWRNREGQGGRTGCAGRNDMTRPLSDDFLILKRRSLFTEGSNSRSWAAAGLEHKKMNIYFMLATTGKNLKQSTRIAHPSSMASEIGEESDQGSACGRS